MKRSNLSAQLILILFATAAPLTAKEIDFAHDIVPILKQHCGKCHTGDQKKGSFSLNSRESVLAGGESGKVVIEGQGARIELIQRILSEDDQLKMPPEG